MKYILLLIMGFSVYSSFENLEWIEKKQEKNSVYNLDYDDFTICQYIYQNSIRWWFGQSVNIDYVVYTPPGPGSEFWNDSDKSKYYLTVFFKLLPNVLMIILIILWGKYFFKKKELIKMKNG